MNPNAAGSDPATAAGDAGRAGTFRLALAMSGAISAGAYTAGVFDFLIRALAEWHAHKQRDEPNVSLVAFSGASAGGVTGAVQKRDQIAG